MFDSLLRLRYSYSRPFLFDALDEGPTWGACVSKIAEVHNATRYVCSVRLFLLFPVVPQH